MGSGSKLVNSWGRRIRIQNIWIRNHNTDIISCSCAPLLYSQIICHTRRVSLWASDLDDGLEAVVPGGGWEQDDEEAGEEDAGKEEEEGLAPHGYSRHHQLHSAARQHRTPSSRRHHHAASRTHQSGKIPQMMGGKKNTGWQTRYIKTRGKRSWGTEWISYWWGGFNHCLLFTVSSSLSPTVLLGWGEGVGQDFLVPATGPEHPVHGAPG